MSVTPLPTVKLRVSNVKRATPFASATRLGRSPVWWSPGPKWPCGLPVGLKWPPALLPSPLEQSPFSWTWKPCSVPGLRPRTSPVTRTRSPCCTKRTSPVVWLPRVGCSCAVAAGPVGDMPAQPARAAAPRPSRKRREVDRMEWLLMVVCDADHPPCRAPGHVGRSRRVLSAGLRLPPGAAPAPAAGPAPGRRCPCAAARRRWPGHSRAWCRRCRPPR